MHFTTEGTKHTVKTQRCILWGFSLCVLHCVLCGEKTLLTQQFLKIRMRLGCQKLYDAELGEFEFMKWIFFDDGLYLFF